MIYELYQEAGGTRASRGITAAYSNQVRIDVLNKLRLGENPALLSGRKSFTFGQAVEAWLVWARARAVISGRRKTVTATI